MEKPRRLLSLLLVMTSILLSGPVASAQVTQEPSGEPQKVRVSFDRDIQTMRNDAFPGYRTKVDDYLQYSPAVLMVGLKAFGYKGRSDWGRMLVSDAFSAAIMAGGVNGLKYSVKRMRPDGSRANSFPSGHTATAFMAASMLNHEYGWRSPWWGFAGYSVATLTSVSRVFNDKHWASDTFAGALIGIGATELGYFLTDLIFKDRHLMGGYEKPEFDYCSTDNRYYSLQLGYARRFILASKEAKQNSEMPYRGSGMDFTAEIPILEGSGVALRAGMGSLLFKDERSFNVYSGQVGLYWAREFNRFVEFQAEALIGYAGHKNGSGIDISAATSLNFITGNNFKIRGIAEWETFSYASRPESVGKPFLNSILLGFNAAFYW